MAADQRDAVLADELHRFVVSPVRGRQQATIAVQQRRTAEACGWGGAVSQGAAHAAKELGGALLQRAALDRHAPWRSLRRVGAAGAVGGGYQGVFSGLALARAAKARGEGAC